MAAVRAAIDIQRAVGSRTFGDQGVALATRIGISTGQVIGGDVGTGKRTSFTLLGDTVNLAARLEELNKHAAPVPKQQPRTPSSPAQPSRSK